MGKLVKLWNGFGCRMSEVIQAEKIKMTAAQAIGINRNNLDDAAFL